MHIPTAMYRLQFNSSFGFQEAEKVIPYLQKLGLSDIYASPIFKATKGSTHGYDVVDSNELNPELGSGADFNKMMAERKKYEMGWLQDIVPNHMAFSSENLMLMDVFEYGRQSRFWDFFDIDWDHGDKALRGKVLVPFLGKPIQEALASNEICLQLTPAGFRVKYYDHSWPLRLSSYSTVLLRNLEDAHRNSQYKCELKELTELAKQFDSLSNMDFCAQRQRDVGEAKRALWQLFTTGELISDCLGPYNKKSCQQGFGPLERLFDEQFFKLAFWKEADKKINYRRFFYLNNYIGLLMENPRVFEYTHHLILRLAEQGGFTGLRIDHIDGLYNPAQYLRQLQERLGQIYVVVEKILEPDESLPAHWPIQGTTGYNFANYVNGLFCRRANEKEFTAIYEKFIGSLQDYEFILHEKKKLIIQKYMAGDINNLSRLLQKLHGDGSHLDASADATGKALTEIIAAFPVYRTYVSDKSFTEADREYIQEALRGAKRAQPELADAIGLIGEYLLSGGRTPNVRAAMDGFLHFVMKFQQLTGPATAKGFEDTLLYCYNRLISLNEVGARPDRFGISAEEFDKFNSKRANQWPHSLNTTSTHDTKRGEDIRARINVLSEMPEQWRFKVDYWTRINKHKKLRYNNSWAPDVNDEYLLYQTLIGALPFGESEYEAFRKRIKEYFVKAVREAKVHSNWVELNKEYESACEKFVDRLLTFSKADKFWKDFIAFQGEVANYGVFNSLSQVLIKITAPGVPDFYQGTELWDLNLVDPDNRRPVDFEARAKFLEDIKSEENRDASRLLKELLTHKEDGRIKMFLIYKALSARRKFKQIFEDGDYVPVRVTGRYKDHIIAFARKAEQQTAITVVPRFLASMVEPDSLPIGEQLWQDTRIITPSYLSGSWLNVITAEKITGVNELFVERILSKFPVGLIFAIE